MPSPILKLWLRHWLYNYTNYGNYDKHWKLREFITKLRQFWRIKKIMKKLNIFIYLYKEGERWSFFWLKLFIHFLCWVQIGLLPSFKMKNMFGNLISSYLKTSTMENRYYKMAGQQVTYLTKVVLHHRCFLCVTSHQMCSITNNLISNSEHLSLNNTSNGCFCKFLWNLIS